MRMYLLRFSRLFQLVKYLTRLRAAAFLLVLANEDAQQVSGSIHSLDQRDGKKPRKMIDESDPGRPQAERAH